MLLCKQFRQDERHYLKQPHSTAIVRHRSRCAADMMRVGGEVVGSGTAKRQGNGEHRGFVIKRGV